jgi:drug/metabolite transporter (DMT)-like permease
MMVCCTNVVNHYSPQVLAILLLMVITGAARSVVVKLFYQFGFEKPMFVTLLYLLGQSLSLVVYFVSLRRIKDVADDLAAGTRQTDKHGETLSTTKEDDSENETRTNLSTSLPSQLSKSNLEVSEYEVGGRELKEPTEDNTCVKLPESATPQRDVDISITKEKSVENENQLHQVERGQANPRPSAASTRSKLPSRRQRGSKHGLTEESKKAIQWVHRIPHYWKPLIPGIFNMCNSAMRWASLVFVPASIAEMLISGLELVLSVVASRLIRKRMVSRTRWIGVAIVTVGIIVIGLVDAISAKKKEVGDDPSSSQQHQWIGVLLIAGQSVMSVLQDLSEEILMQEAEFPATLLLGLEGLFGLVIGSVFYFPLAAQLGEPLSDTVDELSAWRMGVFAAGLVLLFLVTGVFNIVATAVTSSMTRNVWKNFRTILVWMFGLVIFYATQNEELGEDWLIPESFIGLLGFGVMLYGAHVYYSNKEEIPRVV